MNNERYDKYIDIGIDNKPFLGQNVEGASDDIPVNQAKIAKNNFVDEIGDVIPRAGGISWEFMQDPVIGLFSWTRSDGISIVAILDNTNITTYAPETTGSGVYPIPEALAESITYP